MSRIQTAVFALLLSTAAVTASAQATVRRTYHDEGWKAMLAAKYAEAERLFRAAIKEADATSTQDALYAHHLRGLGLVLVNAGRPNDAEPLFRRSLAITEKTEPGTNNHALILQDIADREFARANYVEARRVYEQCVALLNQQSAPSYGALAGALSGIGGVLIQQSKFAEAEPYVKRALEAQQRAPDKSPGQIAAYTAQLGMLYYDQGRYDLAEPLVREALRLREQAGPEHPQVASGLHSLAMVTSARGNVTEAEALYRRSLAIAEKVYGPDNIQLTGTMNNLANIYFRTGRHAEAEALHRRSLALREATRGKEHLSVAIALANIADIYVTLERYGDARPLLDRALAIREKSGPETTVTAASLDALAWWHLEQQQFAAGEPFARRSVAIREKVYGPNHRFVANALRSLALARYGQGAEAETVALLRRAIALDRAGAKDGNRDEAAATMKQGETFQAAGRLLDAKQQYSRAVGLHTGASGPDDAAVIAALNKLASLYEQQGKKTLAAYYRLRAATR